MMDLEQLEKKEDVLAGKLEGATHEEKRVIFDELAKNKELRKRALGKRLTELEKKMESANLNEKMEIMDEAIKLSSQCFRLNVTGNIPVDEEILEEYGDRTLTEGTYKYISSFPFDGGHVYIMKGKNGSIMISDGRCDPPRNCRECGDVFTTNNFNKELCVYCAMR